MDDQSVRERSLSVASKLGYPTNPNLPPLEPLSIERSLDEAVDRVLTMQAVAMCAYGLDRDHASAWLQRECRSDQLTPDEAKFMASGEGDRSPWIAQIEGMWAFAWALHLIAEFDFSRECTPNLIRVLAAIDEDESSADIRRRARLRDEEELIKALDLAYCLHWAVRETSLRGLPTPGSVEPYVIVERRRTLEWLLCDEDWDLITLDT